MAPSSNFRSAVTADHVRQTMLFTDEQEPGWRPGGKKLIRIHAGCYMRARLVRSCSTPWMKEHVINTARIIALTHKKKSCVATGLSAATLHGLDIPQHGNTIHLRTLGKRCTTKLRLAPVTLDGKQIAPEAIVIIHHLPSIVEDLVEVAGIRCESLKNAVAIGALIHEESLAHTLACAALSTSIRQARWNLDARYSESMLMKSSLGRWLNSLPRGRRNRRIAQRVVERANAGCESVGEAKLLFILLRAGFSEIETQIHVETGKGESFYVDLGVRRIKLAIEFDGRAKFGEFPEQIHGANEALQRRQRALEAEGWTVIRVRWHDLEDHERIVAQVRHYSNLLELQDAAGGRCSRCKIGKVKAA